MLSASCCVVLHSRTKSSSKLHVPGEQSAGTYMKLIPLPLPSITDPVAVTVIQP